MRISGPKLLILLAIWIIILIELRTVFGLFGIDIGIETVLVIGVITIGALLAWAFLPRIEGTDGTQ